MMCIICQSDEVANARKALGYRTCLKCGEKIARAKKHAIVPIPKSNYVYAHTLDDVLSPYSHKGTR